jgi:lipoate synthase
MGLAVVDHRELPLEQDWVCPLKRSDLLRKLRVQLTHLIRLPPNITINHCLGNRRLDVLETMKNGALYRVCESSLCPGTGSGCRLEGG